jgi:hypothetical protein
MITIKEPISAAYDGQPANTQNGYESPKTGRLVVVPFSLRNDFVASSFMLRLANESDGATMGQRLQTWKLNLLNQDGYPLTHSHLRIAGRLKDHRHPGRASRTCNGLVY